MKHFGGITRIFATIGLLVLAAAQFGCVAPQTTSDTFDQSMVGAGSINTTYYPGHKIVIDFFDSPGMPVNYAQMVREDGSITLPMNQTLVVAGKKKGEVEQEIRDLYVPRLLKRLTVNIRSEEATYFVRGEVKAPRQAPHTGAITAMKAISAAGDFTDFANSRKIEVIRANGEKIMVNGKAALRDPSKDVPVFPGDTVVVHRRFF